MNYKYIQKKKKKAKTLADKKFSAQPTAPNLTKQQMFLERSLFNSLLYKQDPKTKNQ